MLLKEFLLLGFEVLQVFGYGRWAVMKIEIFKGQIQGFFLGLSRIIQKIIMIIRFALVNALRHFAICTYFFYLLSEIIDTVLQVLI